MRKRRKRRKRKMKFWEKAKLLCRILVIAFAILKMFEFHQFAIAEFGKLPAFKRHFVLVAKDGYWYRLITWIKSFG